MGVESMLCCCAGANVGGHGYRVNQGSALSELRAAELMVLEHVKLLVWWVDKNFSCHKLASKIKRLDQGGGHLPGLVPVKSDG